MEFFKDIKYKIVVGAAVASFFMTIGSACSLTVDSDIFRFMNEVVTN